MATLAAPLRRVPVVGDRALPALALAALTALAAYARAKAFGAHFWIDEGISVGIARHSLTSIPGLLRQDGSPPLYYVLLHLWIGVFGHKEAAVHQLSWACAVLAVPAGWWAASAVFGMLAAGCCAALLAISPYVGLYADEGRMYALVVLLGVLVVGAFLRAYVLRRRRWVPVFAVLMAAILYTHAWGLFLGLSLGVGALGLLAAGPDRRRLLIDLAIGFGAAAVLYAPWLPTLIEQAHHTAAPWSHRPDGKSLSNAVKRILGGKLTEAILLLVAAGGAYELLRRGDGVQRRSLLVGILAAAGTLFIAYAFSRVSSPAWALRYFVMVFAPLSIALGAGLGRMGLLGVATLLVAFVVSWHGKPTTTTLDGKSNVEHVARTLGPDLPRGSLVFSTQPEQVPVLDYYLPQGMRYWTPLGRVRDAGVMDWRDALKRLRAARFARVVPAMLATLPPGGRLLLVNPEFSHPDSPWTRRLHRLAHSWGPLLRQRLRVLRTVVPTKGSSRSTVTGTLLVRQAASTRPHRRRRARAGSSARGAAR